MKQICFYYTLFFALIHFAIVFLRGFIIIGILTYLYLLFYNLDNCLFTSSIPFAFLFPSKMPPMTFTTAPQTKAAITELEEYNSVFNENGDYIGYTTWGFNVEWQKDYGNPPTWAEMTANYEDSTGLCKVCSRLDFRELITPILPLKLEEGAAGVDFTPSTLKEKENTSAGEGGDTEREGEELEEEMASPSESTTSAKNAGIDIWLGTVRELYERHETCGFCKWAFVFAIYAFQKTGAPLEGVVRLKKEVQDSAYGLPKYARIIIDCSELNKGDPKGTQFPYVERRLCFWRDEPEERPNNPNKDEEPTSYFFPFMAMYWLYRGCTTNHPNCAAAARLGKMKEMKTKLFVIDLHDFCIVPAPQDSVYAALSYVWGAQAGEYDSNIISSSDVERVDFPARHSLTMIHACNVVKQFGIRYLWVDQVCIPNDCRLAQISEMDNIYRGAELTVIAGVENAASGLPGVGSTNRKRRDPGVLKVGGINLGLQTWDSATPALRDTTYSTRGWTYQEKVLSPRLLIITEEDVYYSCVEGQKSEHACHESNLIKFTRETLVELGSVLATAHGRSPFQVYADCVDQYSSRDLTYPADIVHGFTGLMNFLEDKYEWKFCWGLPDENFALALLWSMGHEATRRDAVRDDKGRRFPSWSWTGWVGTTDHYGIRPKALVPVEEQERTGFVPVRCEDMMLDDAKTSGVLVLEAECVEITGDSVKFFRTSRADENQTLRVGEVGEGCVFVAIAMLKERESVARVEGLVIKREGEEGIYERVMMVVFITVQEWMGLNRETLTIRLA
jgi:hypothetical protein